MSDTRPYSIIIGGATLLKDNQLATITPPAVLYTNLAYNHVQALWRALGDPTVQAHAACYASAVAKAMIRLGDSYGIQAGRMTPQELIDVEALFPPPALEEHPLMDLDASPPNPSPPPPKSKG